MIFENPGALWLLPVLPFLLWGLCFWGWRAGQETAATFRMDAHRLKARQIDKYLLAGAILALLVTALAMPKLAFSTAATPFRTGEIALLVDVTSSMAARQDVHSPSRLERVKPILYEIVNHMEELGKVKISLHGFTNIARSHVPLVGKGDYAYLKESIQTVLDINSTPGEGTGLGRPISDVVDKFSPDEKTKIVVLFSDGEPFFGVARGMRDTEQDRIDAAVKKANESGVKVVTVGVGEREGAKIPLFDTFGGFTGQYAQLANTDYVTSLEEKGLQAIATRTGGRYYDEKNHGGLIGFITANLRADPVAAATEQVKDWRSIAEWLILAALPLWVIFARRHLV